MISGVGTHDWECPHVQLHRDGGHHPRSTVVDETLVLNKVFFVLEISILAVFLMSTPQRIFSGPKITISILKDCLHAKRNWCRIYGKKHNCDALCIYRELRNNYQEKPKIQDTWLVAQRPHWQYGSAIYVKLDIQVWSTIISEINKVSQNANDRPSGC